MEFKIGDIVVCKKAAGLDGLLFEGKEFQVVGTDVTKNGDEYVSVRDENGLIINAYAKRFQLSGAKP
jgi:hypothetical protein